MARSGPTPGPTSTTSPGSWNRPGCSRPTGRRPSLPVADLGLGYRDSRFKHAPPRDSAAELILDATFRPRPGRAGHHQGAARRHPALAPGPPAARPALGRQRLPQPAGRFGRAADRLGRAQGPPDRRRRRLGEARQLHRQRPEGHGRRRPAPGRAGPGRGRGAPRRLRSSSRSSFVGDWTGWRMRGVTADEPPRRGPARRAVGGARRLDRVGVGHRRGAAGRRPRRSSRSLIDLDGRWWWLPAGHRRGDRPGGGLRRPGSARGATARTPSGRRSIGWPARRPAPVVFIALHGPVRRGRHGPGAARGGRPGVHRVGRGGLGDRHGQGALQAALPRASACRSSTGARSAPRAGQRRSGRRSLAELAAFAAGCRRPAPDGQAGPARQLGRDDPGPRRRPSVRRARSRPPSATTTLALVEAYVAGARDLEVSVIGNEPRRPRGVRPGRDRLGPRVLRLRRQVHRRAVRDDDPRRGHRRPARGHASRSPATPTGRSAPRASRGSTSCWPATRSTCRRSTPSRASRRSASSRRLPAEGGYTFAAVCERIVELALERHAGARGSRA